MVVHVKLMIHFLTMEYLIYQNLVGNVQFLKIFVSGEMKTCESYTQNI